MSKRRLRCTINPEHTRNRENGLPFQYPVDGEADTVLADVFGDPSNTWADGTRGVTRKTRRAILATDELPVCGVCGAEAEREPAPIVVTAEWLRYLFQCKARHRRKLADLWANTIMPYHGAVGNGYGPMSKVMAAILRPAPLAVELSVEEHAEIAAALSPEIPLARRWADIAGKPLPAAPATDTFPTLVYEETDGTLHTPMGLHVGRMATVAGAREVVRRWNAYPDFRAACVAWADAYEGGELEKYDAALKLTKAALEKAGPA